MDFIKRLLKNLSLSNSVATFYAVVKCSDCGEEITIRINTSSDFQIEYNSHNPEHYYTIKKEIIGKNCFNLMGLTLALTRNAAVLFTDTKSCEFVKFGKQ